MRREPQAERRNSHWTPTEGRVTIGNVIGGSIMVGVVYWFVYLRKKMPRG